MDEAETVRIRQRAPELMKEWRRITNTEPSAARDPVAQGAIRHPGRRQIEIAILLAAGYNRQDVRMAGQSRRGLDDVLKIGEETRVAGKFRIDDLDDDFALVRDKGPRPIDLSNASARNLLG